MSTGTGDEQERGREADAPLEISKAGWRDVLVRLKDAIREDRITLIAAGVAFYAMLALFPAIVVVVSVYGLVMDPEERTWRVIDAVRSVAEARGVSMARVALAWLVDRPAVASVILGARTLEQLEDNLGAADLHLSAVETARLDEASAPIVDDYPYGDLGMSQRDRALPAPRSFTSKSLALTIDVFGRDRLDGP